MSQSIPPLHSDAETCSSGPIQIFDCESIPISPGTRVRLGRDVRRLKRWIIWAATIATVILGLIVGWLLWQ